MKRYLQFATSLFRQLGLLYTVAKIIYTVSRGRMWKKLPDIRVKKTVILPKHNVKQFDSSLVILENTDI